MQTGEFYMANPPTSYDYIVIGAGSAGSIVAAGLAASKKAPSVLLLEAGKDAKDVKELWDPNYINSLYDIKDIHWGYKSVPQSHMNNRVLDVWRAKITGGCTAHNDMVYSRGARADYDEWESVHGCTGWAYNDVASIFDKVEAKLNPTTTTENTFGTDFVDACVGLGYAWNPNYNSGQSMFGVSALQSTINEEFTRVTSYESYVPGGALKNLSVQIQALVDRIEFDEKKQTSGVRYYVNGTLTKANVTSEVILCAGSINSPQILMRSGIGNSTVLKNAGVTNTIVDNSEVGQNMWGALIMLGSWTTSQPIYNQPVNEGYAIVWANINDKDQPNNCLEMMRGLYIANQTKAQLEGHYSVTGGAMRLQSKGSVVITTSDYTMPPVIDMKFLSADGDFEQCLDAFDLMREIGNSPGLAAWRKAEISPGPAVSTPDQIRAWILDNTYSYNHPAGTCRMGGDAGAVVDPELKVNGVTGLRVADDSIMPDITSAHVQGPAFMIGQKAVDLIVGTG